MQITECLFGISVERAVGFGNKYAQDQQPPVPTIPHTQEGFVVDGVTTFTHKPTYVGRGAWKADLVFAFEGGMGRSDR